VIHQLQNFSFKTAIQQNMTFYRQGEEDYFMQNMPHVYMNMPDSVPRKQNEQGLLPPSFMPNEFSVICGRGKVNSSSPGNRRLKAIAGSYLDQYSRAKTKADKSGIVSNIIERVREATPYGAFVKKEQGRFWEVDESVAREKIGCILRDWLHTQYKSSTKAKVAKRQAMKTNNNTLHKWHSSDWMQSCSAPLYDHALIGIMTTEQLTQAGGPSDNFGIKTSPFPKATEDKTPFEEQVTATDDSSTMKSIFMAANSYTAKTVFPPHNQTRCLRDILPTSAHHEIMTGDSGGATTPRGIMDALEQACGAVSNLAILKEPCISFEAPEFLDDMSSIDGDADLLSYVDTFPSNFDPTTFFDEE
jgi:hypothetical protein